VAGKRDVVEARRACEELRAQAAQQQRQLAEVEVARIKAEERAARARKAAHSKSTEAEDLKIQAGKWEEAVGFAQELQQQAAEQVGALELALQQARADCAGLEQRLERCDGQVQELEGMLQRALIRSQMVFDRCGELEVELSLAQEVSHRARKESWTRALLGKNVF